MSVKGLLETEKKARGLQQQLDSSFNKQLRELRQELRKVEYLLGDKKAASMWANSPADITRLQQLRSMLDETERLYLEAGNSRAARIFKQRMERQLRQRLTNLKANELEIMMRIQAHRAATEKEMLNRLTSIKREGAARELYMQSRSVGGFISGVGRGFMQDLVTLETKAAGSKTLGEYMNNLYIQYERGLKDVFVKGIIRGDSYEQMENNLMRATDITKGKARLLVRTEANAIFNESVREVIDKNPLVKGYRFRAVLDRRTSKTCQHMDGKYIPKEEVEPGVNFPPLHPNCRSTVTTVLVSEDVKKDTVQRYTKNGSNEWIPVPPGMTYPEFKRVMLNLPQTRQAERAASAPDRIPTLKNIHLAAKELEELRSQTDRVPFIQNALRGRDPEKVIVEIMKPFIDKLQPRVRVPDASVLNKILDEGFKNQIQTGTSRGILDIEFRKSLSGKLFGYDATTVRDEDFEIYGYLGEGLEEDENEPQLDLYGDVVIQLKRDKIKDRTTFCLGDSLEAITFSREAEVIEYDKNWNVKKLAMSPEGGHRNMAWSVRPAKLTDIKPTAFSQHQLLGIYKLEEPPTSLSSLHSSGVPTGGYMEAQYHGGLDASDIESVVLNPRLEVTPELIDKLNSRGIKIYYKDEYSWHRRFGSSDREEVKTYEDFVKKQEEWRARYEASGKKRRRR